MAEAHRVLIVGGGFGGLYAAQSLRRAPVHVTLVDRRNFHLFQPLLYQVATGGLSPANIAAPLRTVLKRQKNVEVLLGEVRDFDLAGRRVLMAHGELGYDTLIVAAGAGNFYFGHDTWESLSPGLKTVEDATEIRRRVLLAFERAERETDPERIREWMTFVVVGGGPTGLELAGALAETACRTMRGEFRRIRPEQSRIVLLEGSDRLLHAYPPDASEKARRQVEELGIEVHTRAVVSEIQSDAVTFRQGEGTETLRTRTVLWGAGVRPSPLAAALARAAGIATDRQGRVPVGEDLSVAGHPEVFAIGDMANFSHPNGASLPGIAPVAMQQGRYVARLIRARLKRGGQPLSGRLFRYRDYGTMATIGRARAVAVISGLKFSGHMAWFLWLFVHLMYIVEFENRVLILFQWAWNYLTWNRTARLITGANGNDQPDSTHSND